jgi:toxin HigB-1
VNIELSSKARKQLVRVPVHIARKFALWVDLVCVDGLDAARAVPGFRDHVLEGEWRGYRAIYIVRDRASIETVCVEEVNKHDY